MKKGGLEYTVTYNSKSHWSTLTQMHGSKWPEVLPYCIVNVALMVLLEMLKRFIMPNLTINVSKQGHSFITFSLSYLLVWRVNTSLKVYNDTRNHLTTMYRETRELVQASCVYSITQTSEQAHQWRERITYRVLMMLRTVMAVLSYPDCEQPAWKVPELTGEELEDVMRAVFVSDDFERWAHSTDRTALEESMRVPLRMAYQCRKTVLDHKKMLNQPLHWTQEDKLFDKIDSFLEAYYGLRTFLTTPTPFPLVQMTRMLLFVYAYTVPLVQLNDPSPLVAHCVVVFMVTYGFLGLEMIAMELDNPFGEDPNDFDHVALARTAYEDAYLTIADMNGIEWADKLRKRMDQQDLPIDQQSENSWRDQGSALVQDGGGVAVKRGYHHKGQVLKGGAASSQ